MTLLLFIKFAHIFVAIKLLSFAKIQFFILLIKRALGILYVNRIDFLLFVSIKTFHKKIGFCI